MSAIHKVVERRMEFVYGPTGAEFSGSVEGPYTWDQLHAMVADSRWGSQYEVVNLQERVITYTDWQDIP